MSVITFVHHGNFNRTKKFFGRLKEIGQNGEFDKYGLAGVEALRSATPRDSGQTAESWNYNVVSKDGSVSIVWSNSNIENGVNIAVILQYGHGTRNGGYVQGRDYINPAIQPIFDQIANDAWSEVTKA